MESPTEKPAQLFRDRRWLKVGGQVDIEELLYLKYDLTTACDITDLDGPDGLTRQPYSFPGDISIVSP